MSGEYPVHANRDLTPIGAPTYLVSPLDFAQNPGSLFLALSRYKVKDTYATSQMLDHAMNTMSGKGFALHELKNLMIATDGRPRVDVCESMNPLGWRTEWAHPVFQSPESSSAFRRLGSRSNSHQHHLLACLEPDDRNAVVHVHRTY